MGEGLRSGWEILELVDLVTLVRCLERDGVRLGVRETGGRLWVLPKDDVLKAFDVMSL